MDEDDAEDEAVSVCGGTLADSMLVLMARGNLNIIFNPIIFQGYSLISNPLCPISCVFSFRRSNDWALLGCSVPSGMTWFQGPGHNLRRSVS